MRRLDRAQVAALRLLERARTIAVVGASGGAGDPGRVAIEYLRRAGFDVVPVRSDRADVGGLKSYRALAEIPGAVDLVLVFGTGNDVGLVERAANRGADGVWFARQPSPAVEEAARRLGLALVKNADIVTLHRERLREAGQPARLGVRSRRRGRREPGDGRPRSSGWEEAGGGGRGGGGGGRAALDEKKMIRGRPGRKGRRRRGRRAA